MQTPEKNFLEVQTFVLFVFFQIVSFLSCSCKKKIKLYLFHFQTFPVIAKTTKHTKVGSIDLQGFHTAFL